MSTEITQIQPSAMDLLMTAVQQGAAIDTIERLAKLQREMLDYEAHVQWEKSMNIVQQAIGYVRGVADNPQTKSKYATFAALDGALRPHYSKEGFSLSFDTIDCPVPGHNRVVCYVSREGYTRRYQIDMAITTTGFKGAAMMTETHAEGASISYGCRYLEKMIFNIAVGEEDRDGNAAKPDLPNIEGDTAWRERCDLIAKADTMKAASDLWNGAYQIIDALKKTDAAGSKKYLDWINSALKSAKDRLLKATK